MSTIRGRRRFRDAMLHQEMLAEQVRVLHVIRQDQHVRGAHEVSFAQVRLGDRVRAVYVHLSGSVESYEFTVAGWGEQGHLLVDSDRLLAVARDEESPTVIRALFRLPR